MEAERRYYRGDPGPPSCDDACSATVDYLHVAAFGVRLGGRCGQQNYNTAKQAFVNHRFLPSVGAGHEHGSDGDCRSVEFGDREPCEILSGVDVPLITENAEGDGFTEDQPCRAIRSPVNPGEIPPQPDVRCELIDFIVDCELAGV